MNTMLRINMYYEFDINRSTKNVLSSHICHSDSGLFAYDDYQVLCDATIPTSIHFTIFLSLHHY